MRLISRIVSLALAATLGCATALAAPAASTDSPSVSLGGHRFSVEIAATPAQQAHGLMERTSMPSNHGMLFVFQHSEPRTFWMKNTLIPLDILFFNNARKLVTILHDVPPCKTNPCPLYPSKARARYALELNAGTATKLGLHKGEVITFSDVSSGTQ